MLLAVYEECFSSFLPALRGNQLKVFRRFSANAVPFHALKVQGRPLIEYCDVSYGQTLGMFLQIHRETSSSNPENSGTLAALYDEKGTVAYKGAEIG